MEEIDYLYEVLKDELDHTSWTVSTERHNRYGHRVVLEDNMNQKIRFKYVATLDEPNHYKPTFSKSLNKSFNGDKLKTVKEVQNYLYENIL